MNARFRPRSVTRCASTSETATTALATRSRRRGKTVPPKRHTSPRDHSVSSVLREVPGSSWHPLDLAAIVAQGGASERPPELLARVDGRCLFYPAKLHWASGEPETCKTWLLL